MLTIFAVSAFRAPSRQAECQRTVGKAIYSNATYNEEGGDVIGYELALGSQGPSSEADLFLYEGAPEDSAFHMKGSISRTELKLEGDLVQKLSEEPSHREVTQVTHAKLSGRMIGNAIGAVITINGNEDHVRLKKVSHLWGCAAPHAQGRKH